MIGIIIIMMVVAITNPNSPPEATATTRAKINRPFTTLIKGE